MGLTRARVILLPHSIFPPMEGQVPVSSTDCQLWCPPYIMMHYAQQGPRMRCHHLGTNACMHASTCTCSISRSAQQLLKVLPGQHTAKF